MYGFQIIFSHLGVILRPMFSKAAVRSLLSQTGRLYMEDSTRSVAFFRSFSVF